MELIQWQGATCGVKNRMSTTDPTHFVLDHQQFKASKGHCRTLRGPKASATTIPYFHFTHCFKMLLEISLPCSVRAHTGSHPCI